MVVRRTLAIIVCVLLQHTALAGTIVFYGNGVDNTCSQAEDSKTILEEAVRARLPADAQQAVEFRVSCNKTGGKLLDVFEAYSQVLLERSSDFWRALSRIDVMPDFLQEAFKDSAASVDNLAFVTSADLQKHVALYKESIGIGKKVLVVPHSQGNLFANQAFTLLSLDEQNSFDIVSVANPDVFVAGNGPYTTLEEDDVINTLRLITNALPANITNIPIILSDSLGHSFIHAYLETATNSEGKILDDLIGVLDFTPQGGVIFQDDFNRPNSATVGNGWSDTAGNTGGNLAIANNELTCPGTGLSGIFRLYSAG